MQNDQNINTDNNPQSQNLNQHQMENQQQQQTNVNPQTQHRKFKQKYIGHTKWQRRFRERDQFKEEYDIPDGDIERGADLFVKSCCAGCHSVDYEYNIALPLEVIYKFRGMFRKPKYGNCSYEWNRNRLYSILWEPHKYYQDDVEVHPIQDSQERADVAEYIMHLKYQYTQPQTWHM